MLDKRIDTLASAACYGAAFTGLLGIIVCIISLGAMNLTAAGVSIAGSGLAFGFLANAILRD